MDVKLNINDAEYKKVCNMIKRQLHNSSITVNIYPSELRNMILSFIKHKLDIDIEGLSIDISVNIDNDDLYIEFILPEDDDLKEYEMLKQDLKAIMGNHIINNDNINNKVLLRTLFTSALTYKVHDSVLMVEYLPSALDELENIKLNI